MGKNLFNFCQLWKTSAIESRQACTDDAVIRIRILRFNCILDQSITLHDFSTELASRHLILCSHLIVDGDDNNRLVSDRAPSKD